MKQAPAKRGVIVVIKAKVMVNSKYLDALGRLGTYQRERGRLDSVGLAI